MSEHGTYGTYQQHRRRGEQACDECKAAARDYARQYRAGIGKAAQQRAEARQSRLEKALRILGRRHPTELTMILNDIGSTK